MQTAIQAIRDQLDKADSTRGDMQIGHILIALAQIVDLIEGAKTPAERDPYEAARIEYQAERRIDEWAAYQRENEE